MGKNSLLPIVIYLIGYAFGTFITYAVRVWSVDPAIAGFFGGVVGYSVVSLIIAAYFRRQK